MQHEGGYPLPTEESTLGVNASNCEGSRRGQNTCKNEFGVEYLDNVSSTVISI